MDAPSTPTPAPPAPGLVPRAASLPLATMTPEARAAEYDTLTRELAGGLYANDEAVRGKKMARRAAHIEWQEREAAAPAEGTTPGTTPPGAPAAPEAEAPLIPFAPRPAHLPEGKPWGSPEGVAVLNEYVQGVEALGVPRAEAAEAYQHVMKLASNPTYDPPDPEVTLAGLREEWGAAFDGNLLAAKLALARLPENVQGLLRGTFLGDDPQVLRRLAKAGAKLVEPFEQARTRKTAIEADEDWFSLKNPERHAALVKEWHALFPTVSPQPHTRRRP